MSELGANEIDNRRLQIMNSLGAYIRGTGKAAIIASGNIAAEVETVVMANGRTYRPWPRKRDMGDGHQLSLIEWLQLTRGEYVFDCEFDLSPLRNLPQAQQLLEFERAVSMDIAAISLGTGGALRWFPSSAPLPRPSSESPVPGADILSPFENSHGHLIVPATAEYITSLSAALDSLSREVQDAVLGSMEWYRLGAGSQSPLNSFLCHWIAIERLANWWFERLSNRMSREEYLNHLASQDGVLVDKTKFTLTVAAPSLKTLAISVSTLIDRRSYAARVKISKAFMHVLGDTAQQSIDGLFSKGDSHADSLKDYRDDIAHGNIDDISVSGRRRVAGASQWISDLDRRFILKSIEKLVNGG